ncbi:MAG: hypothetical protein EA360_05020 [Balneolaceae bacterium]|nr:MAG: hypothetical protein EA360_05020 [Balneolaceae bacterium]
MNFFYPITATLKRKTWIAGLLSVSALLSFVLLLNSEPVPVHHLTTAAELDSLIRDSFIEFNISPLSIQHRSVGVDSLFSRVVFTARVPDSFSKTTFHLHLNAKLRPYSLNTHGLVTFPEQNLRIHLLLDDKVVRTIDLLNAVD